MPRLCSERSRPYPGRPARRAVQLLRDYIETNCPNGASASTARISCSQASTSLMIGWLGKAIWQNPSIYMHHCGYTFSQISSPSHGKGSQGVGPPEGQQDMR